MGNIALGTRRVAARDAALPEGVVSSASKERILHAALRSFCEHGFHRTSIRDIADASSMRSASLYSHYASKAHILSELVRIGSDEHYRRLQDALLSTSPEPEAQIAALVRAHVQAHGLYPMLAVVVHSEIYALEPGMVIRAITLRQQSERLLVTVLDRGSAQGVFDVPDTKVAAAALADMGIRVAYWYDPAGALSIDDLANHYVEFAARLLGVAQQAGEGK